MAGRRASARQRETAPPTSAPDQDAPWLDDEELCVYLAFVSTLVKLPNALDAQLIRDAGISHYEYLVMAALSMAPHRTLRMSDIAEFTDSALSRLSNVAARLEKRGWITRSPDPSNGRYTLATLSADGLAKVEACAPGHVAHARSLVLAPLTKSQQRQLLEICRRILAAIDPNAGPPEERLARLDTRRND